MQVSIFFQKPPYVLLTLVSLLFLFFNMPNDLKDKRLKEETLIENKKLISNFFLIQVVILVILQ